MWRASLQNDVHSSQSMVIYCPLMVPSHFANKLFMYWLNYFWLAPTEQRYWQNWEIVQLVSSTSLSPTLFSWFIQKINLFLFLRTSIIGGPGHRRAQTLLMMVSTHKWQLEEQVIGCYFLTLRSASPPKKDEAYMSLERGVSPPPPPPPSSKLRTTG